MALKKAFSGEGVALTNVVGDGSVVIQPYERVIAAPAA